LSKNGQGNQADKIRNSLRSENKRKYFRIEIILSVLFFIIIFASPTLHGDNWFWISVAFWVIILGGFIYLLRNAANKANMITLYNYFED
jgi:hypothetical protein